MKLLTLASLLAFAFVPAYAADVNFEGGGIVAEAPELAPGSALISKDEERTPETPFIRSCKQKPDDDLCKLFFERFKDSVVRNCCQDVARDSNAIQNYAKDSRSGKKTLFESCVIGINLVYCD